MQADVTAQIRPTQNIQDISDEDIAAGSDDQVSTNESVGDDEMEARKASLKDGEKVFVKRMTRQSKRLAAAKKAKSKNNKTQTTTTQNKTQD